jgi:CRISPR-associated protein Cmr4
MYEAYKFLGLFAETSLHPGTGTTTGVIDLPIQREKHTGFPLIQSSGLKGSMRERAGKKWGRDSDLVNIIFGPEDADYAGSIAITDARLLAFPVRSLSEVYIWITCPTVLSRLKRDMGIIGKDYSKLSGLPSCEGKALVGEKSDLQSPLVIEDFKLDINDSQKNTVKEWIEEILKLMPETDSHNTVKEKMKKHLIVISDSDYSHLVTTATQVSARIILDDKKTSQNLWYEESLPPDCLFYALVMAMKPRGGNSDIKKAEDALKKLQEAVTGYLQIGGNETVGMGWCAVKFTGGSQ